MGVFDDLAKKSLSYRLGLLAFLVGGLLAAYYLTLRSSDSDERDNLRSQQNSLLSTQRKLDKDLDEMSRLAQLYVELEQSIRDNQRALPTEAELPAFFDHLQRKAVDAGVTIRSWSRLKDEPVDMYIRVPVQVEVQANFFNLMKYFYLLGPPQLGDAQKPDESLRISERIVTVEDLHLSTPTVVDGEVKLTARFVASTFRQVTPDKESAAAGSAVIDKILKQTGAVGADGKPKQPAKEEGESKDSDKAAGEGASGGAQ